MRERITITTPSGYSKTSSGQVDASGETTRTVFANVVKGNTRQDININQNQVENAWTFTIRNDQINTLSKQNKITFNSNEYAVISISSQRKENQFIEILAVSSD